MFQRSLLSFRFHSLLPTAMKFMSTSSAAEANLPAAPTKLKPPMNTQAFQQIIQKKKASAKKVLPHIPKLPQTNNIQEVYQYYHQNSENLKLVHYVIIFSRLAHLKPKSIDTTNRYIQRIVNAVCKYRLDKRPHALSSLIKYASIIGIKDRTLWIKFISALKYVNLSQCPNDISLIVNFMSQANIKGEDLWKDLQDLAEKIMDSNLMGYHSVEMLLQGFLNKPLQPGFRAKLISKIKQQASFIDLEAMKNLVSFSFKYRFDDPELWSYLKKWTLFRLNKPEQQFTLTDQYPYMIYCYGRAAIDGLLTGEAVQNQAFFAELFDYYMKTKETLETLVDGTNNAMLAYYGFVTGFSACNVENSAVKDTFNEYVKNHQGELKIRDYSLLLHLFNEERAAYYLSEETVEMLKGYIVKNLPQFTLEQYSLIIGIVDRLEGAEKERIMKTLITTLDYFVQLNPRHKLLPKILKEFEDRGILSSEKIQEMKILFNIKG